MGVGLRSSVGMLEAFHRPLYKSLCRLSLLLFLKDSPLNFSGISVIVPAQMVLDIPTWNFYYLCLFLYFVVIHQQFTISTEKNAKRYILI